MKKKRYLVLFLFFLVVAIVGIIGLAIPTRYENFSYNNVFATDLGLGKYGFNLEFDIINKTDDDFSNIDLHVSYKVEHQFQEKVETTTLHIDELEDEDFVTVTFKHEESDFGIYNFAGFESIKLVVNNTEYDVYSDSMLVGPNWYFFGMTLIGFIAGFVFFIFWKISDKKFIDPQFESNIKTIEESIKNAFEPLTKVSNEPKKAEKITCSYCKCKYDGEKHDKCPNCGAPPEPRD